MNKQQIYDKAKAHLLTQNAKSQNPEGSCMYRGPNGLMCGIGLFIPDRVYTQDMEGDSVEELIQLYCDDLPKDVFKEENLPFLMLIQIIHDEHEPHEWGGALMKLACDNGLDP